MKVCRYICALLASLVVPVAVAEVRMPSIFSDNMMLQQDADVRIFGKAGAGERISVVSSWGAESAAVADADGEWEVMLRSPKATNEPQTLEVKGENIVSISNILIGEVWLCTGQSNMEFPVGKDTWSKGMVGWEEELADSDYPDIRLFRAEHQLSLDVEKDDVAGKWLVCNADNADNFSAVAFVFGKRLHKELGVPVGLVQDAWGGTIIEAWTKMSIMEDNLEYSEVLEKYSFDKMDKAGYPWKVPSILWNGMIAPIAGFTVKGNIWYQGESNVFVDKHYKEALTNLINSWRHEWKQPDMPFYFAQIAPYANARSLGVRDAQFQVWRKSGLKNIGMVATVDVGDSLDLHPRHKREVGERFALWALARQYGRDVVYSGPVFKSLETKGSRLVLEFDYADGGLSTSDGLAVKSFEVAGSDKVFHPAVAEIKGGRLEVYSPEVAEPVAVRYAWKDYCRVNLVNSAGLPAVPFRSDDWSIYR